jgi:hypothetical protein
MFGKRTKRAQCRLQQLKIERSRRKKKRMPVAQEVVVTARVVKTEQAFDTSAWKGQSQKKESNTPRTQDPTFNRSIWSQK